MRTYTPRQRAILQFISDYQRRHSVSPTLEEIGTEPERFVLTPAASLRDLDEVVVTGEQLRGVAHGATFAAPALLGERSEPGPFSVVDECGDLLAVYERRGAGVKPTVVLAPQASP